MAEKTTARWAIPYPTETGNVKVGATDFEEMAKRIDEILYPPGELRLTAKATIESGWIACEGQAVSRTTFKALFEAIGTAYGEGDKSTTFNVPDFRERVPVGAGSTLARGAKGGEATHTLTIAELAKHKHNTAAGSVPMNVSGEFVTLGSGVEAVTRGTFYGQTAAIQEEGGGGAHNNMQPYTVCNVWIKT